MKQQNDVEKIERRLSQTPFLVRGPVTRLLINLGKNEEFQRSGYKMSLYQTRQSLDQVAEDWGKGRNEIEFEAINLSSRSYYAKPEEDIIINSPTPQSNGLYRGTGVRCLLAKKKKPTDNDFIYPNSDNMYLYRIFQKEALKCGFKPSGLINGLDHGYIELPIISQDGNNCFLYAVLNCLQRNSSYMRIKEYQEIHKLGNDIETSIELGARLMSIDNVLNVLIDYKLIDGYEKIRPQNKNEWYGLIGKPVVFSNNRGYRGDDSMIKDIEEGRIIDGHAVCYGTTRAEGIYVVNSWEKYSIYLVTDYSSIDNVYVLKGDMFDN